MCGLVAIVGKCPVNQALFDSLMMLQHRGQDAAGIVTSNDTQFFMCKGKGLVENVVRSRHMQALKGNMGIGHVRYPTAGSQNSAEAQPFYVNCPYGIVLAHNGNLTNVEEIKKQLYSNDLRHINTGSDSEVLLNVFASELSRLKKLTPKPEDIFCAVGGVYERCRGGYSVVGMLNGLGVIGFRDAHGIRPLVYGQKKTSAGVEYMLASESVALDNLGFELIRSVQPGEAIYIDLAGNLFSFQCVDEAKLTPSIFEFVYFARPDSIIDGINIYKARLNIGKKLAIKIQREFSNHDIDVVMPIPETSRPSALELAIKLDRPFREGFVKNRYIGRTFIMPKQYQRRKSVRQKLNVIDMEFEGKNVLLVDDSIVRGTTCKEIITMAREAGARKVYFCSGAPPVRYQDVYGIDTPTKEELIAHNRSVEEISKIIGADRLFYQDMSDLIEAVQDGNTEVTDFDCAVFDGRYVTGYVDEEYLSAVAKRRKQVRNDTTQGAALVDIFNEINQGH